MIFNSGTYVEFNQKALQLIDREDGQSEPETALELLKQCLPKLLVPKDKGELMLFDISSEQSLEKTQFMSEETISKANQQVSVFYNLACCYHRLDLTQEAVEHLEIAAKKIQKVIEAHESQLRVFLLTQNSSLRGPIDSPKGMTLHQTPGSKMLQIGPPRHTRNQAMVSSVVNKPSTQIMVNDNPQDSAKRNSLQQCFNFFPQKIDNLLTMNSQYENGSKPKIVDYHNISSQISPKQSIGNSICSDQQILQTFEEVSTVKLQKCRYHCKFNLQLCALFSQTQKHQDALIVGRKAAQLCCNLIKDASLLCKRYVQKFNREKTCHMPAESSDFYIAEIDEGLSYGLSEEYQPTKGQSIRVNNVGKGVTSQFAVKRESSGKSNKSDGSTKSVVKLKIGQTSSNSRETSLRKQRGGSSSIESLDRIHTFNLKNATTKLKQKVVEGGAKLKVEHPAAVKRLSVAVQKPKELLDPLYNSPQKTIYVEESVKVLEKVILEADPILTELSNHIKDFEQINKKSASSREADFKTKYGAQAKDYRRKLNISFSKQSDLDDLRHDQRLKLNARNNLGIQNKQDWIFNLNIGNVMHLNCLRTDELNTKVEQSHELGKDAMLEKVVLIVTAYFCIATEMKFIIKEQELAGVTSELSRKDSEAFHAKALHIALLFLPPECPLVQHIEETYKKQYLKHKQKRHIVLKQNSKPGLAALVGSTCVKSKPTLKSQNSGENLKQVKPILVTGRIPKVENFGSPKQSLQLQLSNLKFK